MIYSKIRVAPAFKDGYRAYAVQGLTTYKTIEQVWEQLHYGSNRNSPHIYSDLNVATKVAQELVKKMLETEEKNKSDQEWLNTDLGIVYNLIPEEKPISNKKKAWVNVNSLYYHNPNRGSGYIEVEY